MKPEPIQPAQTTTVLRPVVSDLSNVAIIMSPSFQSFFEETPKHAEAWMATTHGLGKACALDKKTSALAYLSVLAAVRLETGVPFHVAEAKKAGATRDEVASAILLGLPAIGNCVISSLPAALKAYDTEVE